MTAIALRAGETVPDLAAALMTKMPRRYPQVIEVAATTCATTSDVSIVLDTATALATDSVFTESAFQANTQSLFAEVASELDRYENFSASWDGYRAPPFRDEVLNAARWILAFSHMIFTRNGFDLDMLTTGPASDGSVDIEFRLRDKELFFTVYPDEEFVRVAAFADGGVREEVLSFGTMAVERWLDWLTSPNDIQILMDTS